MRKATAAHTVGIDRCAIAGLMFTATDSGGGDGFAELTATVHDLGSHRDTDVALRFKSNDGPEVRRHCFLLEDVFRIHTVLGALLEEYGLLQDSSRDLLERALAPRPAGTFAICDSIHGRRGKRAAAAR